MYRKDQNAANHKNSGGNVMSSNVGAMRRLSLLAGSSLMAASLGAVAFTGAALTPTAARAANECEPVGVDPSANGPTPDSYTCPETTYATGITYSSDGDLAVTQTTPSTTVTADGVNLTGNGADDVTWDSTDDFLSGGADTNGPVLDVASAAGDITITAHVVSGEGTASATHAIRATSSGGGDIAIVTTGGVVATGSSGVAAIEATTNGGDVNITTSGTSVFDRTAGRLRGILAQTSGSGEITLDVGATSTTAAQPGNAAIETIAGTGATTINLTNGAVGFSSGFGATGGGVAIRSTSASTSPTTAVNVQNSGANIYGSVDFSGVTAGGVTFNISGAGHWRADGASVFSVGNDTLIFASVQPQASIPGVADDSLVAGASINFGAGNDLINIQTGWNIGGYNVPDTAANPLGATVDFGAGTDTFNNNGILSIRRVVTLANLEAFNNSGVINFGAMSDDVQNADTFAVDILTMPGATFTGSGSSRLGMAVHFDTSSQEGCATPTGAGDCLYLPGGSTAGSTLVTLVNAGAGATLGGFNGAGVTLIDVGGGTSAGGHFSLDPNSEGYRLDPTLGGVIQRPGLFAYRLVYDPDTQRHNLVGLPRSEAMEYVVLGSAAQSIWYMTSQAVTDRQTDLRDGTAGSVWMKASGEYTSRDLASSVDAYADTFAFDNSYKLYAGTLMAGMDFITGESGGYDYVLGAQIGYVGSSFDLDASPSSGQMTGATGGVYGSIWDGALFVDATFNSNFLTLDYDAPGIGSKTTTWLRSYGAQLEGGRRFMLTQKLFAEPLATVAFVRTHFEEISLSGGEVAPDDADSRRAALGLRLGADMFGGPLKVRYFVTGRAWNEFEAENRGVVLNPGDDLTFADDASGGFGEAQAGLSLFNDDQTIAGFLTSGVKFKDGYNAVDLDLGLRLRW